MEKPMDPTKPADEVQQSSPTAGGTATTPTRRVLTNTIAPIPPISDPEERRHRSHKMKSFSQPLGRDLKKKQQSLEFSSPVSTAVCSTASANSGRSFSYPHYQPPNPLTVGDPPNPNAGPDPSPTIPNAPLPEFTGSGGGTGIFKLPVRAPIHPGRPPPLELRPHPLRETQVGSYLRSIACTRSQLWAATECGVRCWELSKVFGELKGRKTGDEESAPYRESIRTPPAMCLAVDEQRGLVWTGHKDGRIRSWKMELQPEKNPEGGTDVADKSAHNFKEGLSWHAHRSAVLSLIVIPNGKLITFSYTNGVLLTTCSTFVATLSTL